MRKGILFLTSIALLAGCSPNTPEEEQADTPPIEDIEEVEEVEAETDETISEENNTEEEDTVHTKEKETSEDTAPDHPLINMVNESTFVDPYALQAWTDYQAVVADVTYGDIEVLRSEEPDISQLDGSSQAEIEELFSGLDLREDVFVEKVDVANGEEMHFYRYPAEEGSSLSEISDFLAELAFYYIDDNLVFSSITPGLYEVELNDLPTAETLTSMLHVSEIEALDSQVFTVAEMQIQDNLVQQLMVPATALNEDGNEEYAAFYFFTQGDDILYYAMLPFELVSQSFPDYSLLIYGEILPEIAEVVL